MSKARIYGGDEVVHLNIHFSLMNSPAAGFIIKDLVKFGKSEKINLAAFSLKRFETLKSVSEITGF